MTYVVTTACRRSPSFHEICKESCATFCATHFGKGPDDLLSYLLLFFHILAANQISLFLSLMMLNQMPLQPGCSMDTQSGEGVTIVSTTIVCLRVVVGSEL